MLEKFCLNKSNNNTSVDCCNCEICYKEDNDTSIRDITSINDYTSFNEYPEFIKQYIKLTGNDDIFKPFIEKLENPDHLKCNIKQSIIALNTLVDGIHDPLFREFIYKNIIDELIIYCFGGK